MNIKLTKSGKFKGLQLTKTEVQEAKNILKDSCLAVAEKDLATKWNITVPLANKILCAIIYNYKYLEIVEG